MFGITRDTMLHSVRNIAERMSVLLAPTEYSRLNPESLFEEMRGTGGWFFTQSEQRAALGKSLTELVAGCTALGYGCFSVALALPLKIDGRAYVVKFGIRPQEDWTARAFAVYCKEYHSIMPGLPEVIDTGTTNNHRVWWAVVPKYTPIEDMWQANMLRHLLECGDDEARPPIVTALKDDGVPEDHLATLLLVREFMEHIGARSDMHDDNVMVDGDGLPVYTDPLHGAPNWRAHQIVEHGLRPM